MDQLPVSLVEAARLPELLALAVGEGSHIPFDAEVAEQCGDHPERQRMRSTGGVRGSGPDGGADEVLVVVLIGPLMPWDDARPIAGGTAWWL